jgi:hypothetical protein
MSKVAIVGDVLGTGTFTLKAPNGNTDRTLDLPDVSATLITDSAGILNIGSGQLYKDASGNVGIGTSSPGARFDVVNSSGVASAAIEGSGTNFVGLLSGGIEPTVFYKSTTSLRFGTATDKVGGGYTERARITSGGDLLVGTTSGSARLVVVSPANNVAACNLISSNSGDAGRSMLAIGKFDNNNTTSQVFVNFVINNGGNGSGQINANGAGAAAFGSSSDARLKENIQDLPPQLGNITALRPVEFDYIESEGGGHQIGFIAQEMQAVYPDAVNERQPDGMLTVTGWSKTEARLVKAIQEQQAIITALTARVEALEAK